MENDEGKKVGENSVRKKFSGEKIPKFDYLLSIFSGTETEVLFPSQSGEEAKD